ncbi:MAG: peptidyl-prolyl cis-trans isomerase [Polyangiaceae bacterium]|nr:peptidyl-prolyl cis-trans isomerase [Polyangiaceae bacterium]
MMGLRSMDGAMGAGRMWVRMVLVLVLAAVGCRENALKRTPGAEDGAGYPAGLTPAQAARVLAKIDGEQITLGEFAATLERMDQFDRLRYRTPERRRELLDEMIRVELLAREAKRRGFDQDAEVQEALRQILRDAILRDARKGARPPVEFSEAEVRAYYEAHKSDYQEPERRRVGHIVVAKRELADKLIEKSKETTGAQWGQLVVTNSLEYKGKEHKGPTETAGDLGMVGPVGEPRGANPRVDEAVRAAVFQISEVGRTFDQPVRDAKGQWHVVRLLGKAEAHARSFVEAERTIRIMMSQREVAVREEQLEADLRKRFPVTIDEEALAAAKVPAGSAPTPTEPGASHDHNH